jgi:transposase
MMGRQRRDQGKLFYEFRLDDRIPQNHLLRRIDVFVLAALADLHKELEPYYSEIGRPSVDPELMIRMLIIGYCCGICSERRLSQEVELHLAYRWFCKGRMTLSAIMKLRQVDVLTSQGESVPDAIRSIGVSEVTYYRWRQEYGSLKSDTSDPNQVYRQTSLALSMCCLNLFGGSAFLGRRTWQPAKTAKSFQHKPLQQMQRRHIVSATCPWLRLFGGTPQAGAT